MRNTALQKQLSRQESALMWLKATPSQQTKKYNAKESTTMKMNNELIAKAKQAKSPEELMALAKENGIDITEEIANEYFGRLHPALGELSDEELDNVAGGG